MDSTQENVMGLNQDAGFEILTGELAARLQELEKAQRRADHEVLEWKMQLQLADEAMYAAGILEASAEQENRLAAIDLQTQERIDHLLVADARDVLVRSSTKGLLKAAKSSLEALSERQVDAYLKLQICRKHCQLQRPNSGPMPSCIGKSRMEEQRNRPRGRSSSKRTWAIGKALIVEQFNASRRN
jgi:hypothetical protein